MDALPLIEIGKVNRLQILKSTPQGLYLGDEVEEILLPNKYIEPSFEIGQMVDVFVYTDSEDRPVATTETPLAQRDEFAWLRVTATTTYGAFLEWGLEKDLLVPFKEQHVRMVVDQCYLVYLYLDDVTDRLVASSKINKFLNPDLKALKPNQQVNLLLGARGDLGYDVIINGQYRGLLYANEIFRPVQSGERTKGFIKRLREDGKIDVALEPQGAVALDSFAKRLMEALKNGEGALALHDKSDPDEIERVLHMSKKNFKKAVGQLYRQRKIVITDEGIRLAR